MQSAIQVLILNKSAEFGQKIFLQTVFLGSTHFSMSVQHIPNISVVVAILTIVMLEVRVHSLYECIGFAID